MHADAGYTGVEKRAEIVALERQIDWQVACKRRLIKALAEGFGEGQGLRACVRGAVANTQDGYFHLALWVVSLVGMAMLFLAARHAGPVENGRVLFGSMLMGWGLFQLVEGTVDIICSGFITSFPAIRSSFGSTCFFWGGAAWFFC
ncbi:MAG: DUF2243 domain-containing protein [Proteobacteria bacterium]|nr:DUF2243 domain-containing protein [Verrucomicrobiota bacterium]NBU10540.1 DUF2243 domain-containing protein [Pseudomonadota bacterium]